MTINQSNTCPFYSFSKDEKEKNQDQQLHNYHDPQVAVIALSQQILHLAVRIDHILLCLLHLIAQLLDLDVLARDLLLEVLCLILCRLDNTDDLLDLVILIPEQPFLLVKYLAI